MQSLGKSVELAVALVRNHLRSWSHSADVAQAVCGLFTAGDGGVAAGFTDDL